MKVTYPALFYYEKDGYFVYFPDIQGTGTQGDDVTDAMNMAADWLGIMAADLIENKHRLPHVSNINDLSLEGNNPFKDDPDPELTYDNHKSFISMVTVDLTSYLSAEEPIKKTLTIPRWADEQGKKLKLNFSQTLTEAILNKASE